MNKDDDDEHSSVINYVMLTFSVKTLWMAIYSIVGPNICQVSVSHNIKTIPVKI